LLPRSPRSSLFPYTTLFRSNDIAHDDFFDLLGVEAGAANGFGNNFGAKLRSGETGEAALEFSDGSADGRDNDGSFHGNSRHYLRSEEHTSELQSRFDLVCRL